MAAGDLGSTLSWGFSITGFRVPIAGSTTVGQCLIGSWVVLLMVIILGMQLLVKATSTAFVWTWRLFGGGGDTSHTPSEAESDSQQPMHKPPPAPQPASINALALHDGDRDVGSPLGEIRDLNRRFEPEQIPLHKLQRYLDDEAALSALHPEQALEYEARHSMAAYAGGVPQQGLATLQPRPALAPLLEEQVSAGLVRQPHQPTEPLQPLPGLCSIITPPAASRVGSVGSQVDDCAVAPVPGLDPVQMLPPVTGQEAQPDSPSAKLALVKGVLVGREIWDSSSSGSSNGECSASKRNFSTSSISTSNTASSTPSGRTISASTRSDAAPGKKTSAARSFIQAVPHSKLAATMRRFSWGSKKKVAAAGQKLTEPDSKLPARPSKGAQRGASLQAASLPAALLPEEQPSATLQAASLPTNLQPQPELKLKGVKVENPRKQRTSPPSGDLQRTVPRALSFCDSPTGSSSASSQIRSEITPDSGGSGGLDGGGSGSMSSTAQAPAYRSRGMGAGPSQSRAASSVRSAQAYRSGGSGLGSPRSYQSYDDSGSLGSPQSHRSRHGALALPELHRSRRGSAGPSDPYRSSGDETLGTPRRSQASRGLAPRASSRRTTVAYETVAAALPADSPTTNPRRFFRLTDLQATDLWAAATLPRASGGDGSCERLAGLGRAALSYHILKNLSDKYPQESRANLHTKAQRFVRRESLSKLRLVWRFPDELGRNQGRTWSDKEQATVVEALLGAADSFHEQRLTRGIVYNIMSLVRAVEQVQLED